MFTDDVYLVGSGNLMKVGFVLILEKQSTAEQLTPEIPFNSKEKTKITPTVREMATEQMEKVAARPSGKLERMVFPTHIK